MTPKKTDGKLSHIIIGNPEKSRVVIKRLIEDYGIDEFDTKTFYADEAGFDEMHGDMDFLPVFSEKKLIHIANIEGLQKEDREKLAGYLQRPYSHLLLVISGSSIKEPLKQYADVYIQQKGDEHVLFSGLYSIRRDDKKQLRGLVENYLNVQPQNFHVVIAACEIYLKNSIIKKKQISEETVKKIDMLHSLDYDFKVGRLQVGPEIESFLYYLFS